MLIDVSSITVTLSHMYSKYVWKCMAGYYYTVATRVKMIFNSLEFMMQQV